ncbi:hypothetical protein V6N13_025451 [Hibiscus sabdariffa]|uniref:Uncharacterized protein n=1 Tax=Hibiscus sabdariffa TaxID=183260 RepID=A0ABR1ZJP6_9ROSI
MLSDDEPCDLWGYSLEDDNSVADWLAKIGNDSELHEQLFLTLPMVVMMLLQKDLDRSDEAERTGRPPSIGIGV